MSLYDEVKRIKADIAALPAEARAVFEEEKTWARAHPALYAISLMGIGAFFAVMVIVAF